MILKEKPNLSSLYLRWAEYRRKDDEIATPFSLWVFFDIFLLPYTFGNDAVWRQLLLSLQILHRLVWDWSSYPFLYFLLVLISWPVFDFFVCSSLFSSLTFILTCKAKSFHFDFIAHPLFWQLHSRFLLYFNFQTTPFPISTTLLTIH